MCTCRIINWRIWLNYNKALSLTRTPVIKSKHKYCSGKRIWSGYIVNNSVCVATWHLYRVASCQIPRYVKFIFLFRVSPSFLHTSTDIVLYNNSGTASCSFQLDIQLLYFIFFSIHLFTFFILGAGPPIRNVGECCWLQSCWWKTWNCDFI